MKSLLVSLFFLIGLIINLFGQAPLEGKFPTAMGRYLILNTQSHDFFSGTNLEQPYFTQLTQLQWTLLDTQKIRVSNMHTIANSIFNKYHVKPKSLYVSLLINNQGNVIYVDFIVKKDHRGSHANSVQITADRLAEIEDMVRKYKFYFTGNTYNLPYFPYGFYVDSYD